MVYLSLDLKAARVLLEVAKHRPGLVEVVEQLRSQVPMESILPFEGDPAISVRRHGVTVEYFDDFLADAMYQAMQEAYREWPGPHSGGGQGNASAKAIRFESERGTCDGDRLPQRPSRATRRGRAR